MSKVEEVRDAARTRAKSFKAQEMTGFVAGALATGALGPQGKNKLPVNIGPVDFDLGTGALAMLYARRGATKNHAYARGYAFQALAGGLRDLGASLSTRF